MSGGIRQQPYTKGFLLEIILPLLDLLAMVMMYFCGWHQRT